MNATAQIPDSHGPVSHFNSKSMLSFIHSIPFSCQLYEHLDFRHFNSPHKGTSVGLSLRHILVPFAVCISHLSVILSSSHILCLPLSHSHSLFKPFKSLPNLLSSHIIVFSSPSFLSFFLLIVLIDVCMTAVMRNRLLQRNLPCCDA